MPTNSAVPSVTISQRHRKASPQAQTCVAHALPFGKEVALVAIGVLCIVGRCLVAMTSAKPDQIMQNSSKRGFGPGCAIIGDGDEDLSPRT